MTEYQPKFRPGIYLKFLEWVDNHIRIYKVGEDKIRLELWVCLWDDESSIERSFEGHCVIDCLDQAISIINFDKILETK